MGPQEALSPPRSSVSSPSGAHTRQECDVHIAFLLTDGFAARMMVRSGVASRLIAQGAQVTVISPNADEAYFQQECQAECLCLKKAPKIDGRIALRFRVYRPYLLDNVMNNPGLKAAHEFGFQNRPGLGFALEIINRTLARSSLFRRFSRAFERQANRSKGVKELLREVRPDLLVFPNPFGTEETVYLLHARELAIPVVCQLLSWDNITAKGTPLLMPDYFISWGPIMTEEMVDFYHFPREKIYECGVPHFDIYSLHDQIVSRNLLLTELNLLPEHPSIFYGMVTRMYCPNELEILTWLADKVSKNGFIKPCSLIIRPHPQLVSGIYSMNNEELAKLKALVGPRVALDIPPVLSEQLAWDLPKNDMRRLASLLAGCAMCLNASSTLSLDACMLDRPVINIGFDGWETLPYERSARRSLDYIHMAKLLGLGGIRIATSFSELEGHINAYLRDAHLDQEGRMLSAAQECGLRDGQAAERVATTLLKLALNGRG